MSTKEPDKIPHLSKLKNGRYKYQRKVPKYAQDVLRKKSWDFSLGSNFVEAVDKARAYASEHDDLLAKLATPADQEEYKEEKTEELAAMLVRMRPNMRRRINGYGEMEEVPPMDRNPDLWKQTSDKMKSARALPPKQELLQLAYFTAYAFGDRETLELLNDKSTYGDAMVEVMRPQRPEDPVDASMYDAMKTALDKRIKEIGGAMLVNPKHTLTSLHQHIAQIRNSKPATIANHKVTTDKLLKFLREEKGFDHEPSILSLSHPLLQEYRDYLLEDSGIKNGSIRKYFDGMNSVFRYAMKENKVAGFLSNPVEKVEMPKADAIEDTMYLPFSRMEMGRIWDVAQEEWSPHNHKSKFSEGRRRAFLMCFRLLLWSGLRPTEVFWLRDFGEVTEDYIYVERTKTLVKRYIPLSDHVQDFYQFTQSGGFEDCIFTGKHRGELYGEYNAEKLKEAMRRSFQGIREKAKVTDRRKVLYSTKDTLLQRLRSVEGYSTYLEVCITGHVKRLEKGRHYGGILGEDVEMRVKVKDALDQITYW